MLYILNNKYPIDTVSMFESKLPIHKKVFEGTYTLHKSEVTVEVRMALSVMFVIHNLNTCNPSCCETDLYTLPLKNKIHFLDQRCVC